MNERRVPDASKPPSSSQVEKAGSRLRKILRGDLPGDEWGRCLEIIERHRQTHARPMLNANIGMRRYAQELGVDAQVTQRLKRMQTIIEKLAARESQMNLARMRDIGGVRVVVENLEILRLFQKTVVAKRRRDGVKVIDYVSEPRQSGYRAVHLICNWKSKGLVRPVEVQLRTKMMHHWAVVVEEFSARDGVNHKQDGYTPFHRLALLYSRRLEAIERGELTGASDDEFQAAWAAMMKDGDYGGG